MAVFVLVHSPLVGPLTWSRVADELRRLGVEALTPELPENDDPPGGYWRRDADTVARVLGQVPPTEELVLVGHSGAGPLLPAIRQASSRAIALYVFVDAGLPVDGEARLGAGGFARYLEELYARGERFPNWRDDDLREVLPDSATRRQMLAELRPQPWAFWTEPIPVYAGCPDAPCAYLRFTPNPAYDGAAAAARRLGWLYREIQGGHFHMLVDPAAVAEGLLEFASKVTIGK